MKYLSCILILIIFMALGCNTKHSKKLLSTSKSSPQSMISEAPRPSNSRITSVYTILSGLHEVEDSIPGKWKTDKTFRCRAQKRFCLLYSLPAKAYGKSAGKSLQGVAVKPGR